MTPLSPRELTILQLELWGEVPRKAERWPEEDDTPWEAYDDRTESNA